MSGIAGIIDFTGAPVAAGLVQQMTAAMHWRGPHGQTQHATDTAAFGHCLLRSTAESEDEQQPLTGEQSGVVLVMDGRIDNREVLQTALQQRGVQLRSRADSELVLRAYEEWGADCISRLDGDFALVLWDQRERRAVCARDRIGNRQLHYHWQHGRLAFATDLHALLLLPWIGRQPDTGYLAEYLALDHLSREDTFWRGIKRLLPARRMLVNERGMEMQRYWEPDVWQTLPCKSDQDYLEYYRQLFADVVRRHSRSHCPLACEVSGGIDSSAIFATAEHLRRRHSLQAPSLQGYTLKFDDGSEADELVYARAVGRHLGVNIKEIAPTLPSLAWYRDRAARTAQFPSYPNGVMGLGIREQARNDGSRVLLVGVGGDEWLGGRWGYYAEALAAGRPAELWQCFARDWSTAGPRRSLQWLLFWGLLPLLPAPLRHGLRALHAAIAPPDHSRDLLLAPPLRAALQERRRRLQVPPPGRTRRIGQRGLINILDAAYYVEGLEWEERLCAEAGLELRRPCLDPAIIQFAYACPERLRRRGLIDRPLHRQSMEGVLPDEVVWRKTKADFMGTFRHYLPELVPLLCDSPLATGSWIDRSALRSVVQPGKSPENEGWALWTLWTLFGCDAMFANTDQAGLPATATGASES